MDESQTSCSLPSSVCSMRPSLFAMAVNRRGVFASAGFNLSALSIQVLLRDSRTPAVGCTLRWHTQSLRGLTAASVQLPSPALVSPLVRWDSDSAYRAAGRRAAVTQCKARRHAMVRSATTNISCGGTLSIRRSLHSTASRVTVEQSTCTAPCGAARDVQYERDVRPLCVQPAPLRCR